MNIFALSKMQCLYAYKEKSIGFSNPIKKKKMQYNHIGLFYLINGGQ